MSFHYRVCGWTGRLGNHLLQLSHAIYLAEKYNGICTFAYNDFFHNKTFDFSSNNSTQRKFDDSFWELNVKYSPQKENYSLDLHRQRSRILKEYILPIFIPYKKIEMDYDLVINIRGGSDIFFGKGSPPQYVQSPVNYFLYILEKENPNSVLLVCEDDIHNPVIDKLKQLPYNIEVHAENEVFTDINEILNAKKFVIGGVSTFSLLLSQMSPNITKVYYPKFEDGWNLSEDEMWKRDHWYNFENFLGEMDADIQSVNLEDYIKIGQWGNYDLEEKYHIMLNHPIDKIN